MVSDSERGSSMIVALVALVVVTMAVLLVARLIQYRVDTLRLEEKRAVTGALADASMAETLARLDQDRLFSGLEPKTLGNGWIESSVSTRQGDRREVIASGRLEDWRTTITAEVDMRFTHPRVVGWSYQARPVR